MDEERKKGKAEESIPLGKRTGRDGLSPEAQPAEFTDELRFNRFEPPPELEEKKKE